MWTVIVILLRIPHSTSQYSVNIVLVGLLILTPPLALLLSSLAHLNLLFLHAQITTRECFGGYIQGSLHF